MIIHGLEITCIFLGGYHFFREASFATEVLVPRFVVPSGSFSE
jgi:hypothetical protein